MDVARWSIAQSNKHVLIEKRGASNIKNIRAYKGTNCDSDHYLVSAHFRCRVARTISQIHKPQRCAKLSIEKLKESETRARYQQKLNLNELTNSKEVETMMTSTSSKMFAAINKNRTWTNKPIRMVPETNGSIKIAYRP